MSRTPKRSTLSNQFIARYPVTLTAAHLLRSVGVEKDTPEPIDFTPVPRKRNRRGGWSEQARCHFLVCHAEAKRRIRFSRTVREGDKVEEVEGPPFSPGPKFVNFVPLLFRANKSDT